MAISVSSRSEDVNERRAAAFRVLLGVGMLALTASCASAPRNKVLDTYPAGVAGHTSVFYYDIHGRTFAELRADMRRLGPKLADGSFVGETRSPMRWSWRTQSTGPGSCEIRDVTVSVNAQITLPRWTPPADAEPGLAEEWTRFIAALETHEAGHKDISAKAGRDIQERLRGLSGICSQVGTRANDLTREIVEKAEAEQKSYDAATRHGITQGTSFGPRRPAPGAPHLVCAMRDCSNPRWRGLNIKGCLHGGVRLSRPQRQGSGRV